MIGLVGQGKRFFVLFARRYLLGIIGLFISQDHETERLSGLDTIRNAAITENITNEKAILEGKQ